MLPTFTRIDVYKIAHMSCRGLKCNQSKVFEVIFTVTQHDENVETVPENISLKVCKVQLIKEET